MKSTANPGRLVTQSVDKVCKSSQMYVTPIQRPTSAMRGGERVEFVDLRGCFCWENKPYYM